MFYNEFQLKCGQKSLKTCIVKTVTFWKKKTKVLPWWQGELPCFTMTQEVVVTWSYMEESAPNFTGLIRVWSTNSPKKTKQEVTINFSLLCPKHVKIQILVDQSASGNEAAHSKLCKSLLVASGSCGGIASRCFTICCLAGSLLCLSQEICSCYFLSFGCL